MRLALVAMVAPVLASLALGNSAPTLACTINPMPTPPVVGAVLGEDCNWYLLDGSAVPAVGDPITPTLPAQYWAFMTDLNQGTGSGALAEGADSGNDDLPVYIILPGAILLPLAVLFVFSFIWRGKGGGGH